MISVIVPVYNEEAVIPELVRRLAAAASAWGQHEIIFIDDGSRDRTARLLTETARNNHHFRLISFSRNFGHQAAVSAGLDYARGKAVAIIDGDLQDPPEMIGDFIKKWQEGYEVVYATRATRREHFFKRLAYRIFYRLLSRLSNIAIPLDAGDFCLMDRQVVDAIVALPERNRFIRGLRAWAGFSTASIPYNRQERFAGEPKYTFRKLLHLALDGITGFSVMPLKLATYFGFAISLGSVLAVIWIIIRKLAWEIAVPGWASLSVVIFFIGGIQLFIMGVLGEYIGRIFIEVQHRPVYMVKTKVGFDV